MDAKVRGYLIDKAKKEGVVISPSYVAKHLAEAIKATELKKEKEVVQVDNPKPKRTKKK